ncbi:hypothetical protein GCM10007415_38710 [Parapedobacter pyrenivorans]|uniref:3-keto-alpha-glucoside-1,2-lyase/3-keto-2-hydroxy-glucal hydratase domain-containing protein n=1 Tax=Parapedobacter pyrenivorans TaxID=1305674 RepID=A0A917I0B9_9SPHI|nr:DUF1080 domain-containing protein [Parapedobacter pyrenivorans]GGG99227.1 hypothetical protein GCM10007415_38710 [Parapedobacter pyrenivorans]
MNKLILSVSVLLLAVGVHGQTRDNMLTTQEQADGWQLLFNGKDLTGWKTTRGISPDEDWQITDGVLSVRPETKDHRDIISDEQYSDFDLRIDFKITEGANSGIKYFFTNYEEGGWLGPEYQIIDNQNHPDAKLGLHGNRQLSTLYDLLPVTNKVAIKVGEWNQARIVAQGSKVTHYVNGQEVLTYDRKSPEFKQARELSKFKDVKPSFGTINTGHVLLQDHGDVVFFKNIKIKSL